MDGSELSVATPERVSLNLQIAGVGYRAMAWAVDAALMLAFWLVCYFAASLAVDLYEGFKTLSGIGRAAAAFLIFFAQWAYWTLFEIFRNGQTPGKRLLRIRVVSVDGRPVQPLESVLRNLFRVIDFLPLGYAVGLLTMLLTADNRRVGDLIAGTVLVKSEQVDLSRYAAAPPVATGALPVARALLPAEHDLVLAFLARANSLDPKPRQRLARDLAEAFAAPGASVDQPEAFLRALARQG